MPPQDTKIAPQRLGKPPEPPEGGVAIAEAPEDRPDLTTMDEQRLYDDMLEKDFIKIDPKTRKPVSVDVFYRVIHTYPQFASANPAQYRAQFVIEEFEFQMNPDGTKRRQVRDSHNVSAKEFRENYQPTIIESIAQMARDESKRS